MTSVRQGRRTNFWRSYALAEHKAFTCLPAGVKTLPSPEWWKWQAAKAYH